MDQSIPNPTRSASTVEAPAGAANRWLQLAIVLAGAFIILLDGTIVNVAIPSIQRDIKASYEAIEWVLGGYALAYGLLLIPAGRLGDRFGRKRLFLIGLAGFTLTSALCALSSNPSALVGWRVLQGAMAGLLNPAILAIIQTVFPPRERGKAFGLYGAVSGLAVALGPLLGGALIVANLGGRSWEPIFWVNVPIGLVTLVCALRWLDESHGRAGAIDWLGVALISLAVLLLVYPLIEGRTAGWPLWMFVAMIGSVPVFGLFAWWQRLRIGRGLEPLIDIRLFRNRAFTSGVLIGLFFFAGFIGLVFALSLFFQIGLAYSPLLAGVAVLPWAVGSFIGASLSDMVAARLGRNVLAMGSALVMLGMIGLVLTIRHFGAQVNGWHLAPSLAVGGFGSGFVIAPNTDLVLEHAPTRDAGSAGGVLSTAQRVGQALGVAIVGVVLFSAVSAGALTAAETERPALVTELGQTSLPAAAVNPATDEFVRCFALQTSSSDPFTTAPGCPDATAGDPVSNAFSGAASRALTDLFASAFIPSILTAFVGVLITFGLVFLIPPRPRGENGGRGI